MPIVSWIKIKPSKEGQISKIIQNCKEMSFYFSHSFYCEAQDEHDVVAYSEYKMKKYPAIIGRGNVYGVQFHPEVTHTKDGKKMVSNFLFSICNCSPSWTPDAFIESTIDHLKDKIEDIKTATLFKKKKSTFEPDYCAVKLPDNPWIVQPFEIYEELRIEDIIKKNQK